MLEGAERTGVFLENVADFFRYNVRKVEKDTTIQEELQLLDSYMYILNVRYLDEIKYEKECDKNFLNIRIPSMVLQPIVENAVTHGTQKVEDEGHIEIKVYKDDDKVMISIKDNGKGIDKLVAERIMAGENMHSESGTGIGLDNVRSRLCHYFNQDDVFMIREREDRRGTEVLLRLPIAKAVNLKVGG